MQEQNGSAEQHREKGLKYMDKYNYSMAAIEFIRAVNAGDARSYAYLGQLLYDGEWTRDGNQDVNGALGYWKAGMESGDELCKKLYEEHKEEYIKHPTEVKFKNGDRYKGDVNSDGLPHGSGHMSYKLNGYYADYDGMWENGERSGKGHYRRSSKGGGASHRYEYTGEWLHDKEHGYGTAEESDEVGVHLSTVTEVYTGEFREGRRHGHGVVVRDSFDGSFANGKDRFEGEFEGGRTIGHGVWEYANGDRFEGEFKDYFVQHGHGAYTFKDGFGFEGEWQDGRFVSDSFKSTCLQEMPILIVTEHHSGFDYNKTGTFLIPVKEAGKALYEKAAVISKDSSFNMNGTGIMILAVTPDSVTVRVDACFTKDSSPVETTIKRGQSLTFEDSRKATATIYDEDYDYTIESSLVLSCQ